MCLGIPGQIVEITSHVNKLATVEVLVPSGGRVGWHRCFIGVTVARGTYEVLSMRESFWP